MGCGCGRRSDIEVHKTVSKRPLVMTSDTVFEKKKPYTIIDVIVDEILGRAKKVTRTQHIDRLAICYDCDELTITRQCKKCGCFVKAKTLYAQSFCPAGNWDVIHSKHDVVE